MSNPSSLVGDWWESGGASFRSGVESEGVQSPSCWCANFLFILSYPCPVCSLVNIDLSWCCDKTPDTEAAGRKGCFVVVSVFGLGFWGFFFFTISSKVQSLMVGESWDWELEAADHIASIRDECEA